MTDLCCRYSVLCIHLAVFALNGGCIGEEVTTAVLDLENPKANDVFPAIAFPAIAATYGSLVALYIRASPIDPALEDEPLSLEEERRTRRGVVYVYNWVTRKRAVCFTRFNHGTSLIHPIVLERHRHEHGHVPTRAR